MIRSTPSARMVFHVAAFLALMATSARATSNLNLSKSNINRLQRGGTLVTATTDVRGETPSVVYTTPANADFVVTQICAGPINGGVFLGSGWPVPPSPVRLAFVGGGQCQTFTPGMPLPPNQTVTCAASFDFEATTFCTITGILSPPLPTATPRP